MEAARIEAPRPPASLDVYFVDVGKGDGIVLDYGDVEIVVDAGQGRTAMWDFLSSHALVGHEPGDVPVIELVVLTHPDPDHYGGFPALAKRYAVREVWDPGYDRTDRRGYREALESLRQANHGGPQVVMKRPLECYHVPIAHPGVDADARFVGSDAGVALRVGNDGDSTASLAGRRRTARAEGHSALRTAAAQHTPADGQRKAATARPLPLRRPADRVRPISLSV